MVAPATMAAGRDGSPATAETREFTSIDELQQALAEQAYIADRGLATALYLALKLKKPLLLEGEAGVGKTEVARVLARILDAPLIRLQCYEGLDIASAAYEWNYSKQMLHIRLLEATGERRAQALHDLFGAEFLVARPLLQAITSERRAVLLIDEIDRADAEFEAFLLEVLAEFQITIPELGTIKAKHPPAVIITSNRTRELHDALKRRCLYHWIDYPSLEKELEIVLTKVPQAPATLAEQICRFVQRLRRMELYKVPGVAETLDWASALVALEREQLTEADVADTIGCLLKNQEDVVEVLRSETLLELLRQSQQEGPCEL